MLGRFLEITVPAPRILESWRFWESLGFAGAPVGETWTHRCAVATDGRVAVGLHQADVPPCTLTYVRPDLARHLPALESVGVEFEARVLGDDRFNEASFTAAGDQPFRLLEARTWSPPARAQPSPFGWFEEYAIPVRDLAAARDYWERLGFVAVEEREYPWPSLALTSDTLDVGLHAGPDLGGPTLVFATDDVAALRERLAAVGIETDARLPRALDPRRYLRVTSPEGLRLLAGPGTA